MSHATYIGYTKTYENKTTCNLLYNAGCLKITGCVLIINFWINLILISLQNINKQG